MSFVLVTQSREDAREDAPPFIPESMLLSGLWGVSVYGPYDTLTEASKRLRRLHEGPPAYEGNLVVIEIGEWPL